MKASAGLPRQRKRTRYQQVSAFEQGRMVGLREAGLSYHDIAVHTGMLLRQLCMYGSGEKRVVRRDEQVLDHVM